MSQLVINVAVTGRKVQTYADTARKDVVLDLNGDSLLGMTPEDAKALVKALNVAISETQA